MERDEVLTGIVRDDAPHEGDGLERRDPRSGRERSAIRQGKQSKRAAPNAGTARRILLI